MQQSSSGHPVHLALVSEVRTVGIDEVSAVAAAIQLQLTHDFGPIWGVPDATIAAYESTACIPGGAWPVILGDGQAFSFPSLGLHFAKDGTPFALIKHTREWSVAASHEVLEMCTDPTGDRVVVARAINTADRLVEYLLEICDPCEATENAYRRDGMLVSDFYTPHYFDADVQPDVSYSFAGSIKRPRQVLLGGYLSWWDSYTSRHWQLRLFDGMQGLAPLVEFDGGSIESRRTEIDRVTPSPPLGGPVLTASGNGGAGFEGSDKFSRRIQELRDAAARSHR